MSRPLPVALVQAPPRPATAPLSGFAAEVGELIARFPQTRLVVYPELHLCGVTGAADGSEAELWAAAEPLDGPRARQLAELAGDLGIWLVPGSVCERGPGGELFNTALAFSPEGRLAALVPQDLPVAAVRALRPRRPLRRPRPAGIGRVGFSICYDAWFPEVARHLAWMGAEVIINPVMTTTADRAQELVLARANAIVNQVFVRQRQHRGPVGTGRSLVVDPEGRVRAEAPDDGARRPHRRAGPGRRHPGTGRSARPG